MKDFAFLLAIPVFVITLLAEWLYFKLKRQVREKFDFADTITNLTLGVGSHVFTMIYGVIFVYLYEHFRANYRLFNLSGWGWLPVVIVLFDFVYYWAHRWGHEWNIFWGAHVVHHQSERYNLSVALRQPWFHNLIAFPLFSMFPFIGFDTAVFFTASVIVTLYQYWIHTEAIRKMPAWFEFIFNTPSHHRVHHGRNAKYIDKNYAAVFIVWDRIFGTFEPETEKPQYGITVPFKSYNPFWANIYFYLNLFKVSAQQKGLLNRLKLLFLRPDSLYADEPSEVTRSNEGYNEKPGVPLHPLRKVYILFQFTMLVLGLALFMYEYPKLTIYYKYVIYFNLLAGIGALWALIEKKTWAKYFEAVRILIGVVCINAIYYRSFSDWFVYMFITLAVLSAVSYAYLLLERTIDVLLQQRKVVA
ncbi:MAG: sterol desaturase family protein [Chitinophagales bacterium]|nr:sterol desaturase family protein [Chitinophagales bacterium]MDW8419947.1 sterol desaturase family protein [Chitinophagales bacterium]